MVYIPLPSLSLEVPISNEYLCAVTRIFVLWTNQSHTLKLQHIRTEIYQESFIITVFKLASLGCLT